MDLLERVDGVARHPWETARAAHVAALLNRQGVPAGSRLLDAGSGDSFVAEEVLTRFEDLEVTCWDINYSNEDLAERRPGLRRVAAFPDGPYDVLLALDVLEHVSDDGQFLRTLLARSTPDSLLVITVPAYQWLFSPHDVYLRHYRRYSRRQLAEVLTRSGWSVLEAGGFFTGLLPIRGALVIARRLGALRAGETQAGEKPPSASHLGHWNSGPALTRVLHWLLVLDAAVGRVAARRGGIPGLSLFAVAVPATDGGVQA